MELVLDRDTDEEMIWFLSVVDVVDEVGDTLFVVVVVEDKILRIMIGVVVCSVD